MSSILIEKALSVSLMAACELNNIWLHGITAAIAIYFGFIATPDLLELSSGAKLQS
ncbi:MAG: hypothetical protein RMZ41_031645 [Nostoc sp. DedVER02]|uniref:hypothetical protein n=1 Tax=unclassified Nostoc TaxID=2593658 RepID=UPI002AD37A5B|nr:MULTISPECIES: hypothetical protein [unclassified Nostoc]MDZ7988470.1 hypothetical protein [Nostoc sp. DedVER02]MDZ8112771.1 hypothetical protein [Nostoc sp. DedVER01b]